MQVMSTAPSPPVGPMGSQQEAHRVADPRQYRSESHENHTQHMFTAQTEMGELDPNQSQSEVSFVLERNVASSTPGTKIGLFSLALICCICCFSSFFSTS